MALPLTNRHFEYDEVVALQLLEFTLADGCISIVFFQNRFDSRESHKETKCRIKLVNCEFTRKFDIAYCQKKCIWKRGQYLFQDSDNRTLRKLILWDAYCFNKKDNKTRGYVIVNTIDRMFPIVYKNNLTILFLNFYAFIFQIIPIALLREITLN